MNRLMGTMLGYRCGFTRMEALAILGALTLIMLVTLPFLAKSRKNPGVDRINCLANLKQIAQAFSTWADEHKGKFPMQAPETEGGSLESALSGKVAPTYVRLSNELVSPQVLLCSGDKKRYPRPKHFETLTDSNVSYFFGLDADSGNYQHLLAGDRNLRLEGTGTEAQGLVLITNETQIRWTTLLHNGQGNVALADGSVLQTTTKELQKLSKAKGFATNRLVVP